MKSNSLLVVALAAVVAASTCGHGVWAASEDGSTSALKADMKAAAETMLSFAQTLATDALTVMGGSGVLPLGGIKYTPDAGDTSRCRHASDKIDSFGTFVYQFTDDLTHQYGKALHETKGIDEFVEGLTKYAKSGATQDSLRSMKGLSAGYGAGFGFEVQCGNEVVFTMGMGFGGGYTTHTETAPRSGGFGYGGGMQFMHGNSVALSYGGGAGCGLTDGSCGGSPDPNGNPNRENVMSLAEKHLAECGDELLVCISGGGGGGLTQVRGGQCDWGAGYSFEGSFPWQFRMPGGNTDDDDNDDGGGADDDDDDGGVDDDGGDGGDDDDDYVGGDDDDEKSNVKRKVEKMKKKVNKKAKKMAKKAKTMKKKMMKKKKKKKHLRALNQRQCASSSTSQSSEVAQHCATSCSSSNPSQFNPCFCTCFKNTLTERGVSWAHNVQCSTSSEK